MDPHSPHAHLEPLSGHCSPSTTEHLQGLGAMQWRKDLPPKCKTVHAQRDSEAQPQRLLPHVRLQSELIQASV